MSTLYAICNILQLKNFVFELSNFLFKAFFAFHHLVDTISELAYWFTYLRKSICLNWIEDGFHWFCKAVLHPIKILHCRLIVEIIIKDFVIQFRYSIIYCGVHYKGKLSLFRRLGIHLIFKGKLAFFVFHFDHYLIQLRDFLPNLLKVHTAFAFLFS